MFLHVRSNACYACMHVLVFKMNLAWQQLRNNLVDLASYSDDKNTYRNFVRWVERQPWRKGLPAADEHLICNYHVKFAMLTSVFLNSNFLAEGSCAATGPEKGEA